jgi:hypothetical protein
LKRRKEIVINRMPMDYVTPFVDCTMASLSLRDKREDGRWNPDAAIPPTKVDVEK